jgi:hypothetical protein
MEPISCVKVNNLPFSNLYRILKNKTNAQQIYKITYQARCWNNSSRIKAYLMRREEKSLNGCKHKHQGIQLLILWQPIRQYWLLLREIFPWCLKYLAVTSSEILSMFSQQVQWESNTTEVTGALPIFQC